MPAAPISRPILRRLEETARAAARHSYSPYSNFQVGSAVLGGSGRIYGGCNVENASYGLCTCAERTAIGSAIAAGEKKIEAVIVYTPKSTATMPCGACRQVINEFGPEARVIGICDSDARIEALLPELLTAPFGPADLLNGARRPVARKAR